MRLSRGSVGLGSLLVAQVALRLVAVARQVVNSDEPQHLHVAWAWAQGMLPYRDVCDNHSPFFSLLMSPIVALVGARADIVPVMRLAMIPIVLASLVATWRIAATLFSPRVAWLSVALIGVNPTFLRASVEYRTDQLWMALWLWMVATAVGQPLTLLRAMIVGLLGGMATATSMKTMALVLGVVPGFAWTMWLRRRSGPGIAGQWLATRSVAALIGCLTVPLIFAAGFGAVGSWDKLVFNVVGLNLVPGLGLWGRSPLRPAGLLVAVPLVLWVAREIQVRSGDVRVGMRRALVFTAGTLGWTVFELVWPLVVRSDILPNAPLMAVFATAGLLAMPQWLERRWPHWRTVARVLHWFVPAVVIVETLLVPTANGLSKNGTRDHADFERALLRVTRPEDYVMDVKGEAVFRRRPCYLIIETITRDKVDRGLLPDSFPEQIARAKTPVVCEYFGDGYPQRAQSFIDANYLSYGWLRVAGKKLAPSAAEPKTVRTFTIEVPQCYALVTEAGPASGVLDGTPYVAPRELAAGFHAYQPADGERTVAVVWAPAIARGLGVRELAR